MSYLTKFFVVAMPLLLQALCFTTTLTGNGFTLAIDIKSDPPAPTGSTCSALSSDDTVVPSMTTDRASLAMSNGLDTPKSGSLAASATGPASGIVTSGAAEVSSVPAGGSLAASVTEPASGIVTSGAAGVSSVPDSGSLAASVTGPASKTTASSAVEGTSATHEVVVGPDSELSFLPNQLTASVGDVVHFVFRANNHSIVQSSVEQPCVPFPGGFNSGFNQFNPNNDADITISFTVNSNEPRYFFCDQRNTVKHCALGMVFALNAGDEFGRFANNVLTQGPLESVGLSTALQTVTSTFAGKEVVTTITSLALPAVSLLVGTVTIPTFFTSSTAVSLVSRSSSA
ncbi:hypothetical protein LTR70_004870 [Exophiala xenobiotica]|uniref:Extracellular serine-rich protein n=1 Tax=Lithohypha guttulata TaxID=1690604 RepID=A0ABR0KDS0_9EURO|nr:hypothetical protein LTR24_004488 [Lithohypha guttulata]KAK5319825.1 hypothetical protein LTR70_004870 [Exophiala xenobiotica]